MSCLPSPASASTALTPPDLPSRLVGSYAEARKRLRDVMRVEPLGTGGRLVILSALLQRAYTVSARARGF